MIKFIGYVHNSGTFKPDANAKELEYDNYILNMINNEDPLVHGFQPQLPVKIRTDDLIRVLRCTKDEISGIFDSHLEDEILIVNTDKIRPDGTYRKVVTRILFPG